MAKKNLINADMLLATPKKQDETRQFAEIPVAFAPVPPVAPPLDVVSIKKGLKNDETRATFIVREDLLEKLKAVAYWKRMSIKDVVNEAIEHYVGAYERQNGNLKDVPKKS